MSRLLQIVGKSGEREIVMLEGGFYWHPWTGIDGVLDVIIWEKQMKVAAFLATRTLRGCPDDLGIPMVIVREKGQQMIY